MLRRDQFAGHDLLADEVRQVDHRDPVVVALGNQPEMKLTGGGGGNKAAGGVKKLKFASNGGHNIRSTNKSKPVGYMVLIGLNIVTDDHFETVWQTHFSNGKVGATSNVTLKRIKV